MSIGSAPAAREERALGRRVLAAMVLAAVAAVYVLLGALPMVSFTLPQPGQHNPARTLAPQSWAFFTKSPRTPTLSALEWTGGGWRDRSPGRLAVPGDLMGLDRSNQVAQVILFQLEAQVPEKYWTACEVAPTDCLSSLAPVADIVNPSTRPEVCGDVGLVIQEVVPWVWRDLPAVMPSRVVRVRVTC